MLSGSIYEGIGQSRRPAKLRELFVESVSLAPPRLTAALFFDPSEGSRVAFESA